MKKILLWKKSIGIDQSSAHSGFWSEASGHGVHPVLELLYHHCFCRIQVCILRHIPV